MSGFLVDKLLKSFDELDRCINITKEVLTTRDGVPTQVLARVCQYSDIVARQREFASELRIRMSEQNWVEVGRLVKLINGLSTMIRDDAQSILSGAYDSVSKDSEFNEGEDTSLQ